MKFNDNNEMLDEQEESITGVVILACIVRWLRAYAYILLYRTGKFDGEDMETSRLRGCVRGPGRCRLFYFFFSQTLRNGLVAG
jgi:hypothetical protein